MMTAPLSGDLRRRLLRAVDAGSSARDAARRFEVSASAAIKLMRRVRETGSAAPAKIGGYLRELTTARPGITLAEIQAALTGASTNMVRRYGWGPRGERLVDAAPHGHWRTSTFVAGLRSTGFVAPLVLDGPMTGEAFRAYVEQCLAPALAPGDVVVMDNLATHKVAGVHEAIRAAKAGLMHLPAYSPDLNPIELAFATLKTGLRRAGARTRDALCSTIGCPLDTFTEPECRNYLAISGYAVE